MGNFRANFLRHSFRDSLRNLGDRLGGNIASVICFRFMAQCSLDLGLIRFGTSLGLRLVKFKAK